MPPRYRTFSHTADTGIEVEAATLAELYATCAYAMFDLMVELETVEPQKDMVMQVAAPDPAQLVVDLLSQLLAIAEIEGVVFCRFDVGTATETKVEMVAGATPADTVELCGPPVKAVTYHALEVAPTADGWRARIVFDV